MSIELGRVLSRLAGTMNEQGRHPGCVECSPLDPLDSVPGVLAAPVRRIVPPGLDHAAGSR